MKLFAVIVFSTLIAATMAKLTDEQKEKLKVYKMECIKSTEVDVADVEKSKKGEFTDDPKFKEFLFCLAKKTGTLNEAGEYQVDVIKAKLVDLLGAEKAATVVEACIGKPAATPQETSFALTKCFYEKCHNHLDAAQS